MTTLTLSMTQLDMKTEMLMYFCQDLFSIRYSRCLMRTNQEEFQELKSVLTSPKSLEIKRPKDLKKLDRMVKISILQSMRKIKKKAAVSKSCRAFQRLKGKLLMLSTIEVDVNDIYYNNSGISYIKLIIIPIFQV